MGKSEQSMSLKDRAFMRVEVSKASITYYFPYTREWKSQAIATRILKIDKQTDNWRGHDLAHLVRKKHS